MYSKIAIHSKGAVKLSVNVSNFTMHHQKTLSLLDHEEDSKENSLSQEIQKLRKRFGLDIVKTGNEF
jgi:DNA polymerase-4